jgi:hypothetical protein
MQTDVNTTYKVTVYDTYDDAQFFDATLYPQHGWDDTSIAALAQTLRDFGWPGGVGHVQVTVSKNVDTTDKYACNLAVTPPVFN